MNERNPVVFLHGLIGSLERIALVLQTRARESSAPDLLGYGAHRGVAPAEISIDAQVAHVYAHITERYESRPVDIVGHSVGGVIAMLLAREAPGQVRKIVSVEGNFTLRDAFWSEKMGRMSAEEADQVLFDFQSDPACWLKRSSVTVTPENVALAESWLSNQPGSTLRAMGRAVVEATAPASYLQTVEQIFDSHAVYLLAGERSHAEWDVPNWARQKAAGFSQLTGCGHMMMMEAPDLFIDNVLRDLDAPSPGNK